MNEIDDLRNHLFETLAALKNKDAPMDLDRAKAVAEVARVIIDSAKVEVEFVKVTGAARSTNFLPVVEARQVPPVKRQPPALGPRPVGDVPVAESCVLCGIRLTTAYLIERGICGSCSERPEAAGAVKNRVAR